MHTSPKPWPLLTPATLGLLLSLQACATQTPIHATDVAPAVGGACLAFGVMNYDRLGDTLPTIAQIKSHNAAYRKLCSSPIGKP